MLVDLTPQLAPEPAVCASRALEVFAALVTWNKPPRPLVPELIPLTAVPLPLLFVVANKVDLLNQSERHARLKDIEALIPGAEIIPCSTKTKEGRNEIQEED